MMFLVLFENGNMDIHQDAAAVVNQMTRKPGTRAWEISAPPNGVPELGSQCTLSGGIAIAQHVRYELQLDGEGVGFGDVKESLIPHET